MKRVQIPSSVLVLNEFGSPQRPNIYVFEKITWKRGYYFGNSRLRNLPGGLRKRLLKFPSFVRTRSQRHNSHNLQSKFARTLAEGSRNTRGRLPKVCPNIIDDSCGVWAPLPFGMALVTTALERSAKLPCPIGYGCAGSDFAMSVGTLRCCSGISSAGSNLAMNKGWGG
jgi:hypothetical protein